jgi:GNAT superfamily N-acetyltransferase
MDEAAVLRIVPAFGEPFLSHARNLFREYAATLEGFHRLPNFDLEVASLPSPYAPPGGRILLAVSDEAENPDYVAGCVALRSLDRGVCEMKRLYVRPTFQRKGVGQKLVEALIAEARSIGHEPMVLDTLPSMAEAHKLYVRFGFREIASYQKSPIPGALFFELRLRR